MLKTPRSRMPQGTYLISSLGNVLKGLQAKREDHSVIIIYNIVCTKMLYNVARSVNQIRYSDLLPEEVRRP